MVFGESSAVAAHRGGRFLAVEKWTCELQEPWRVPHGGYSFKTYLGIKLRNIMRIMGRSMIRSPLGISRRICIYIYYTHI